jgi:hypothetical protein
MTHVGPCISLNASTTYEIPQGWNELILAQVPCERDEGDWLVNRHAKLRRHLQTVWGVPGTAAHTPQSPSE